MPSDHQVHAAAHPAHDGKPLSKRLHRFLVPVPKLPPPVHPALLKREQNRADARRQVIADEQWRTVQDEDKQNKELLELSRQILALTKEVRSLAGPGGGSRRSPASDSPAE
jgi:hypothetical protein